MIILIKNMIILIINMILKIKDLIELKKKFMYFLLIYKQKQ